MNISVPPRGTVRIAAPSDRDVLRRSQQCLADRFGIQHSTLQVDLGVPCHQVQHDVP